MVTSEKFQVVDLGGLTKMSEGGRENAGCKL